MSIASHLFIEAPLSLRELTALCGFSTEQELSPIFDNRINIQTDLLLLHMLIMSEEEHNQAAPYGIESDFKISISSHIYYEDFLELIVEIIKTTPYNLGLFMSYQDEPILIKKDQKLSLNSDPDQWTPEWLDMFKDIPHELATF